MKRLKRHAPRRRPKADLDAPIALTRRDYESLLDRLEDLEDAIGMRRHIAAHGRRPSPDAWPAETVDRLLAGEHPLRLWREHRGLTMQALADRAGLRQGYISEIEAGKKTGRLATLRKLAAALGVEIDDIAPP